MKIFISQPMAGKSEREILDKRSTVIETLKNTYPDCEIIDSFIHDNFSKGIQFIGKSITQMSDADLVVFLDGWDKARGCKIEEMIAKGYGIKCMYL